MGASETPTGMFGYGLRNAGPDSRGPSDGAGQHPVPLPEVSGPRWARTHEGRGRLEGRVDGEVETVEGFCRSAAELRRGGAGSGASHGRTISCSVKAVKRRAAGQPWRSAWAGELGPAGAQPSSLDKTVGEWVTFTFVSVIIQRLRPRIKWNSIYLLLTGIAFLLLIMLLRWALNIPPLI